MTEDEIVLLSQLLQSEFGILVTAAQHYTVARKVEPVMLRYGIDSVVGLKAECRQNTKLSQALINAITINETFFFRDKSLWTSLEEHIVPDCAQRTKQMRLLNCACSKGQEVYSLAMLLDEQGLLANHKINIDAFDIDTEVLSYAKAGCYTEFETSRGLNETRKNRYFQRQKSCWQIDKKLQSIIQFSRVNLNTDFTFARKYDVIFCRNILIYFSTSLKTEILARLATHANDQAYLIVGGSESLMGLTDKWSMQHIGESVCYRKR